MRNLSFFLVSILFVGCAPASVSLPESSSSPAASSPSSFAAMDIAAGTPNTDQNTYLTYRDGVEGAGRPVLLFFYSSAESDLFSQKTNAILTELYRTNTYILPTYRAEFTTAAPAQHKYHVLLPDTIVLVDGEGNAVASRLHPTEADIKDLLTRFKVS